jgi:uncharacterized protein (TIGR03118 family)
MTVRCRGARWFLGTLLVCLLPVACGGCGDSGDGSHTVSMAVRQTNLVSDGAVPAALIDPNLVNAWGLVASPTSPWWIADNGAGRSTLYNVSTGTIPLIVTVPGALGQQGTPTGIVFNGGTGFVVTDSAGTSPARFLFASEDGIIAGFRGRPVVMAVDNSASGAVYKGLAIDSPTTGNFLYAANFHAGTVDVFDNHFNPVHIPGAFTDPTLPDGYAPFGIQNLGDTLYVTYAKQDDRKHDDVSGVGNGFVEVFDTNGHLMRRFASRGPLNSPWGLVRPPAGFGTLENTILVGNFGDGHINAFDPASGLFVGQLTDGNTPLTIDGLWGLSFGNGGNAGGVNTLFFTAGPNEEMHGLFGMLQPMAGTLSAP